MDNKQKINKVWIIHGGVLFFFLGSLGLFFLLEGGTKVDEKTEQYASKLDVDSLPDANYDKVADNRLEAYNRAAALMEQEHKEQELQNEHNSFHFFVDDVEEEQIITTKSEQQLESENEVALQSFKNSLNGTPTKSNKASARNHCQPKYEMNNIDDNASSYDDLEALKEKEKKEKLEHLKDLYYGSSNTKSKENTITTKSSDETVIKKEAKQPITNGFKSINSSDQSLKTGSIRAVIHGEQKNITSSSQVRLRILDPIKVDATTIPANTIIVGKANFYENRVRISIENIAYNNNVYPFKGTIYDRDGFQGIYFPDNLVNDAKVEAGSETVSGTDISMNGVSSFISTGTNAIINATKNVFDGSIREIKVTLPSDYKLIIMPYEQ